MIRTVLTTSRLVGRIYKTQYKAMASLSQDEISRYSRQLILPEIGVEGQLKIKNSSILIVGAGGLGCPAALYLTAAGFGKVGIIDDDVVDRSNLHRQVLHNEERVGQPKVESALETLGVLNSHVAVEPIKSKLNAKNAIDIVKRFDMVLDATDNAMTRYLLSDVCVLNKKPLISGAALRFEGQLTVYNYDANTPCYRCLFPNPPPPGTVTNCSDGGVMGVVPGIIGSLQALEAIKIASGNKPSYAGQMLLFDGMTGVFRNIKIRNKKPDCVSCGQNPTIGTDLIDYEAFVGGPACSQGLKILAPEERLSVMEYKRHILDKDTNHLLIDVRPKVQTDMSKVAHALSIPLDELQKGNGLNVIEDILKNKPVSGIYVMCRKGNASQIAVKFLKDSKVDVDSNIEIKDIIGGIEAWAAEVDPSVPLY